MFARYCRIVTKHVKVITETDDLVELSFTKKWKFRTEHGKTIPLNIDKRYAIVIIKPQSSPRLNVQLERTNFDGLWAYF